MSGKPLTLKEIQDTELNILVKVDSFCRKHNIKYSLYAGTMLGAVRHKGFIPWDDDIDICMDRENYEKFLKEFKGDERYKLATYRNDKKANRLFFSKVFDTFTIATEEGINSINGEGLWLDIFPFDYVPEDGKKRQRIVKKFYLYSHTIAYRQETVFNIKHALFRILFFWKTTDSMYKEFEKYCSLAKPTKCCTDLTSMSLKDVKEGKKVFPVSYFSNIIPIEFEHHTFSCLANYDDMLTRIYGDYMKLPPIEKRQTHHIEAYFK